MQTNGKPTSEAFLTGKRTQGYRVPYVLGSVGFGIDDRPRFTWMEAERMRRDPEVMFGLGILRAPLSGATWEIRCNHTRVSEFVDAMYKRFWMRCLRKNSKFLEYGISTGELVYKQEQGLIVLDELSDFHPRDVRPLEYYDGPKRGSLAGLRVKSIGQMVGDNGQVDLLPPNVWWFPGESEFGSFYGRPRLAGAYEPWLEKRGRNGATDSRRLWFKKCAFRGGSMRYPDGVTDYGDETEAILKNNQDIARELVEKFENGGVMALPNTRDLKSGNYLWEFEPPSGHGDVSGILDYPKDLDREILIGLGIPPELVEAATVGSGYSGRAIPAQMFFASMDEIAYLVLSAVDRQIIRPLVEVNFGKVSYQVIPGSLAKTALQYGQQSSVPTGMQQQPQQGQQDQPQDNQQQPVQMSDAQASAIEALANQRYPHIDGVNIPSVPQVIDEIDDATAIEILRAFGELGVAQELPIQLSQASALGGEISDDIALAIIQAIGSLAEEA